MKKHKKMLLLLTLACLMIPSSLAFATEVTDTTEVIDTTEATDTTDVMATDEATDTTDTTNMLEANLIEPITVDLSNSGFGTISIQDSVVPSDTTKVSLAVWSTDNGQDDLKWYSAEHNTSTNTWDYNVNLAAHKTYGNYNVHAYATTASGSRTLADATSFTVTRPTATEIKTTIDNASGTFTLTLSGIDAPSGVKQVQVPIWNASNKATIVWYTATKDNVGNYVITSSLSKHKNLSGTYLAHAYIIDMFGNRYLVQNTTMTFTSVPLELNASPSSSSTTHYDISLKGSAISSSSSYIAYAVWSLDNGKDDLKWYRGSESGYAKNTATIDLANHKSYGTYMIHAYEVLTNGSRKILDSTTFTIQKPAINSIDITTDNNSGDFKITLSAESNMGISQIAVPVWSESHQSNIIWYTAKKQSDGTYTIDSNIFKHKNMPSTYQIHAYIKDVYGNMFISNSSSMSFTSLPVILNVADVNKDEHYFKLDLTGSILPASASHISYAVWSTSNGKDDLIWYKGSSNTYGINTKTIDINNHKTNGTYNVHAYQVNTDGSRKLIAASTFTVDAKPSGELNISNINNTAGTFTVTLSNIAALSGVDNVRIPVWTQSNQSDIFWYTASKVNATTYTITVDVKNHNYNFGTFYIHSYVKMNNGISSLTDTTSQYFKPSNFVTVLNLTSGYRTIIIRNVPDGTTSVQLPTWSSANGQDDLVWYDATKSDSGYWSATIKMGNHKDYGTFYTHVYYNHNYVAAATSTTYEFYKSDVLKNGWYYETGGDGNTYKFYYKDGELQTDLDGILPIQSSYVIKINRAQCTITIYAQDGSNGYIIPVKAMVCSVGLGETPTVTGTFYSQAKYRWHELMGPSYGQYCTRITGSYLIHSVPGDSLSHYNLYAPNYNSLGMPASHGCVRTNVADAKWIYDNCKLGSKIIIYDNNSYAGPFGKPATIWIPMDQTWDPTDPAI